MKEKQPKKEIKETKRELNPIQELQVAVLALEAILVERKITTTKEIEEMKETVLEYTLEYMAFKEQKKRKWEKWSKEGGKE